MLIVTAELLNGCLTRCEVLAMDMFLQCDGNNVSVCAWGEGGVFGVVIARSSVGTFLLINFS